MSNDYKNAGVDVEAGDALVDWLQDQPQKQMPHFDKIVSGIGGFASLFRLANFKNYRSPCLVTCTDGVGTKVKIASQYSRYEGIGQDLVAMCVNDLICTGGEPLLFLDYYAVGKLDLRVAQAFLQSVRQACQDSDCALVGGETAEMPGVYQDKDFDCAGFAVGIVEEDQQWGATKVKANDAIIGVASSGFHSNGYSLLRKVFEKDMDSWVDELLKPTALYVQLIKQVKQKVEIHALAHITGGGIDNIPRVLPTGHHAEIKMWQWPSSFKEVQARTKMSDVQMMTTLNCGLGLVMILPASEKERALSLIQENGHKAFELGLVRESENALKPAEVRVLGVKV